LKEAAILPIKKLSEAKTRLSSVLSTSQRRRLAEKMFDHVWETCLEAGLRPYAVTSDSSLADELGKHVIVEPGRGLNKAIEHAIKTLRPTSYFIILPDLPMLTAANLKAIHELGAEYVVCPDKTLRGTNIVYVSMWGGYRPCFGSNSLIKHLRQTPSAKIYYELGTAFDVDKPRDLSLLRSLSSTSSRKDKQRGYEY
jgi:2-phospho-L-lactate guanylyltransferase